MRTTVNRSPVEAGLAREGLFHRRPGHRPVRASWVEGRKVVLKSGDEGKAKVTFKVQGGRFGVPSLPPALPLRAQLSSTTGTCWEAEFRAAGVTTSTPTVFAAKPHVGP